MQFKITDPFFEELKRRRHRGEIKLGDKRGEKAKKASQQQKPRADRSRRKTA